MSAEEIQRAIEELAQSGDGADRRWALNKLEQRSQTTDFGQPPVMSQLAIIDRLRILMRGSGKELVQIAYHREFNTQRMKKYRIEATNPADYINDENIQIDLERLPRTLKQLYKRFPQIKRPGIPPGFPSRKGIMVQQEWVRQKAIKMIVDEEREKIRKAAEEVRDDQEENTEAPGDSGVGPQG